MNKKLLAVAVVGALASPAAFAQTTLYGIVDVGYQYAGSYNSAANNKNFVEQGMRDPSRLGVRGSEDLAGGMYAMYGLEMTMLPDGTAGAPVDVSRLAFVGLGSKAWGELTLGRQYTHLFHTYAVGSAHAYGTFTSGYGWSGTPTRASNAIKYSSPVFSGFSVGAIWSPSGQNNDEPGKTTAGAPNMNQKQNYWDGAIRWTPGPFGAAVAYGQNKQEVPVTGTTTTKITEVSGNWDNKAFGIYATYSKHKTDVPTATGASDWKIWNVSGVARFGGVHEVYLMGGQAKQSIAVAGAEPKTSLYGIVYENVLSKRTRLYAGYGYAKNEGGATLAPTAYAAAPATQIGITSTVSAATNVAPNEKPKGFQLGISHTF